MSTGTKPRRAPLTRPQRACLLSILAAAFAARILYLLHALRTPGYVWQDPDGYVANALRLVGPDGWRWTFEAVTYTIHRQEHALPPLYSVFLSLFAGVPGFPLTVLLAQAILAVAAVWLVFAIGRLLHSARAGLLAAAGYAFWIPSVFNVWSTSQETLYVPLLLFGFWLLARAIALETGAARFVAAGLAFGAAGLTRSMPMFFVVPAGLLHFATSRDRRRAALQTAAFVAGFLIVTGPYTAALSWHFGQLTIIDTHGTIFLDPGAGKRVPGLPAAVQALWRAVAADPAGYLAGRLELARSVLHVNGGRLLQIYVLTDTRTTAVLWKAAVHLGLDALLIVAACLAAPGAALCRRPVIAAMLVLWTAINILVASVAGFGGARMRAPFEPVLLLLAAVVLAGGWRRPGAGWLAASLALGAVAAAAVLPQVPRSLQAWPDYGMRWPSIAARNAGEFEGMAGFNVPAFDGVAEFEITPAAGGQPAPARIHVRVGGVGVREVDLSPGEALTIRTPWPRRGLAYVELAGRYPSGEPATVHVRNDGR